jgi:hypothetical protein
MKKNFKSGITNNDIFNNVFNACSSLLNEDTELALELTNETAPPQMGDYEE